jgi:hypothetical protein
LKLLVSPRPEGERDAQRPLAMDVFQSIIAGDASTAQSLIKKDKKLFASRRPR